MSAPEKPRPRPTPLTQPFWDACRRHELIVQRCADCGVHRFFPAEGCHRCGSGAADWVQVEGRGTVYSWIVVHRPPDPAWANDVPYVVAVVELPVEGAPLVTGTLVDCPPDAVRAGMPVEVDFDDVDAELTLARWCPAR